MEMPRHPDGSLDLPAGLAQIRAAAARLSPHVRRTPVVASYADGERQDRDVTLKLENLQRTGSFKIRGSLNKILGLDPDQRQRGLITASAGNHAQGVALAAQVAGIASTVVMPMSTALVKIRRTEGYGARVIRHGESWDEAQALAVRLADERGLVPIHAFDDAEVVFGQGTVGLEIIEQVPDLGVVVVPVGGGGLIAGMAIAIKALAPAVRIVGVQAAGADAMARAFRAAPAAPAAPPHTIADGIRIGRPGTLTTGIVRSLVDEVVTVTDDDIITAVVETLQRGKMVAETAGVAGLAALASGRLDVRGAVCVVLTGGNIDLNFLGRLIESDLAGHGFYHPVPIRLRDAPGQLQGVLTVLAGTESNIVDIQHYRSGWKVPVGFVDVEILLETRRAHQGAEIEDTLREHGFDVMPPRRPGGRANVS